MEKYIWRDLQKVADLLLISYSGNAEFDCAKAVWTLLEMEGLTSFKNEVDKNQVLMLFLGVIEFTNDCTSLIRDDDYELEITMWAEELSINRFRIAQLAGSEFENTYDTDEEDLFESALYEMLEKSRSLIVDSIKKKYSDSMKIMKFIGDFYEPPSDESSVSDEYMETGQISISNNIFQYFDWIDRGMPRRK